MANNMYMTIKGKKEMYSEMSLNTEYDFLCSYEDGLKDGRRMGLLKASRCLIQSLGYLKWVDLGLPSNTLIASDFLTGEFTEVGSGGSPTMLFREDVLGFDIITTSVWSEIMECCDISYTTRLRHVGESEWEWNRNKLTSITISGPKGHIKLVVSNEYSTPTSVDFHMENSEDGTSKHMEITLNHFSGKLDFYETFIDPDKGKRLPILLIRPRRSILEIAERNNNVY